VKRMRRQVIILITTFVFALALCGAVSADNTIQEGVNASDTNLNTNSNLNSSSSDVKISSNSQNSEKTTTDNSGHFVFENMSNETHVIWINQGELPESYRDNSKPEKIVLELQPGSSSSINRGSLIFRANFNSNKIEGDLFDNITGNGLKNVTVYDPPQIKILAISGDSTIKPMIISAKLLMQQYPEVTFKLMVYDQLSNFTDAQFLDLLQWADIMYLGTGTPTKISNILKDNQSISTGKTIYSGVNTVDNMAYSRIKGVKIFENFTTDQLNTIYNTPWNNANPLAALDNLSLQYPPDALIQHWIYCRKADSTGISTAYNDLFGYLLNKHTNDNKYNYSATIVARPDYCIYRNGKIYSTFEQYQLDYPIDPLKPTAGIFLADYLLTGGDAYLSDNIADKLVNKGFNVIIATGKSYEPALTALKTYFMDSNNQSRVDVVITMQYTTTIGAKGTENAVKFFEKLNVPVLQAMTTTMITPEQWMISDMGLPIADVGPRIALPEMQGAIEPILVAAVKRVGDPITGALVTQYVILEDRVTKVVDRAYNWVLLGNTPNSEKKIAMIYYSHSPGKASIGAFYLNVAESIINILNRLKAEGYTIGEIPQNADELINTLLEKGINIANWAPGNLENMSNNVVLWPVEEYEQWFAQLDPLAQKQIIEGPVGYIEELTKFAVAQGENQTIIQRIDKWQKDMEGTIKEITDSTKFQQATSLLQAICSSLKDVVAGNNSAWNLFYELKGEFIALNITGASGWGQAPGEQMTIEKNGKKYFLIPGIMIGNIFICPEPLVGYEFEDKLFHCQVFPPPHQFLAVYAWIETVFKANAEVHVGKHAKFEWRPLKQTALSDQDYPDIAIGNVPSPYIYIMDNAEMLTAKRRGLSVIVDHLTPPLKMTDLYGPLVELQNLINDYTMSTNVEYKNATAKQILNLVQTNHLEQAMGINLNNTTNDELVEAVDDYLTELEQTLMPYGLHTFGKEWSPEKIALMVSAMLSQDSENYKSLHGLLATAQGKDLNTLSSYERAQINDLALTICNLIVNGTSPQQIALNITTDAELQSKLNKTLGYGVKYTQLLIDSPKLEMSSLINSLNAGYVTPRVLGDPVSNPASLPTGANAYGLDPSKIPTEAAYTLGSNLANMTIKELGKTPEKIAIVLFSTEISRDNGVNIAFALNMMGIKVDRNTAGKRTGLSLIPLSTLGRPRVDVVITTSGLFRDTFGVLSSEVLDRAARLALAASYDTILANNSKLQPELDKALETINAAGILVKGNESLEMNYIAKHWLEMVKKGYSGDMAITRVFAPPIGTYGTKLEEQVGLTWTWEDRQKLANSYLSRMSNAYTETQWGVPQRGIFEEVLKGTQYTFHSKNSNLMGALDNDDYYSYLGGVTMASEYLNGGNAPQMYILNYADRNNPKVETVEHFINRELITRSYNPEYIKAMMNEGYAGSSTGTLSGGQFWNNLWGWQVTTPQAVNDNMWNEIVDVYLKDKHNIGVTEWMSTGNRAYSAIDLTGTLLTAAHKGYWKADSATLKMVANKWAQLIADNGVACCDCSCGNIAMMKWATSYINADLLSQFNSAVYAATGNSVFAPASPGSGVPGSGQTPGVSPGQTGSPGQRSSGSGGQMSAGQLGAETGAGPGPAGQSEGAGGKTGHEVSEMGTPGSSNTGMPIWAIAGVILLTSLVAVGYFKGGILAALLTILRK